MLSTHSLRYCNCRPGSARSLQQRGDESGDLVFALAGVGGQPEGRVSGSKKRVGPPSVASSSLRQSPPLSAAAG